MFVITPFFVTLAVVPPFWNHLGTKHPPTPPIWRWDKFCTPDIQHVPSFCLAKGDLPLSKAPVRGNPATRQSRPTSVWLNAWLDNGWRVVVHCTKHGVKPLMPHGKLQPLERRLQEGRAGHGDLGQTKEEMFGTKGIYALENEHFEHYHGGLVQMIFVFKGAIFFGSMLIFQGVGRFLSGGVWMSLLWFLCLIFVEVKYERFLQEA